MEVTPVPGLFEKETIDKKDERTPLLGAEDAEQIRRVIDLLTSLPGVETAHAMPPFIRSSWPDILYENYPLTSIWDWLTFADFRPDDNYSSFYQ